MEDAMGQVDTLWVVLSSVLVFFMVYGIALFYAGLVPARNAINTIKMSFFTMAMIMLVRVFIGYSLAFSGQNSCFFRPKCMDW